MRFLDDDFCLRFLRYLVPSYEEQVRNKFNKVRAANSQVVIEKIEAEKEAPRKADEELARNLQWVADMAARDVFSEIQGSGRQAEAHKERERKRDKHIERMHELDHLREQLLPPITTVEFEIERAFEDHGVDVVLKIMTEISWVRGVEIGPSGAPRDSFWSWRDGLVEDVLDRTQTHCWRRLSRGVAADEGQWERRAPAPRLQFIKTFATAGKRVVFLHKVEAAPE